MCYICKNVLLLVEYKYTVYAAAELSLFAALGIDS